MHSLSRAGLGDAGQYKLKENDIIEVHAGGRREVRFRTARAAETPAFMVELIELCNDGQAQRSVHPLIALGAFNLDLLCIHPFRDGNGRVSRLILLLMAYQAGLEVGRYISLERLIEQNNERHYETLKLSSEGWHQGAQNPWHYINFVLYTLIDAYKELERRVGATASPRGSKTALILDAIDRQAATFQATDLRRDCPGLSLDLIRRVLKDKRNTGEVECEARGPKSLWRKTDKWKPGNV